MNQLFTSAFIIICIWFLMQEGSPLFFIRRFFDRIIPIKIAWVKNPLYDCVQCMSSIYGTILYLVNYPFHAKEYLLFILPLCGILVILNRLLNELR